eukprot:scaffold1396_cov252-Pinguiococcus_pyrenoidosus.AAC.4
MLGNGPIGLEISTLKGNHSNQIELWRFCRIGHRNVWTGVMPIICLGIATRQSRPTSPLAYFTTHRFLWPAVSLYPALPWREIQLSFRREVCAPNPGWISTYFRFVREAAATLQLEQ